MSKIQKALNVIAAQRKKSEGAPERAERFVKRFGPNVSASPEATSAPSIPEVAYAGIDMAGESVQIDVSRLESAGFWQTGDNAVVIREQFRRAKRPIIANAFGEQGLGAEWANVVLVSGAMPGVGKTFCAMNLARSISHERDIGVVLIDGDVLKSSLTTELGLEGKKGVLDYLVDESMPVEDVVFSTDLNGIFVVPAGQHHPESAELLASLRMRSLMHAISKTFANCLIIVDSPPMLVTNEAHILSAYAGQVVLVIAARSSSQDSVMQALASLDRKKPINAILNKSPAASVAGAASDSYGYYPFVGDIGGKE